MKKLLLAAALAIGTMASVPTPAFAQESAYTPGTYMEVQGIYVEDGQLENYMDYIADRYRRVQDFARQRGWISGYRIFANVHRRGDEPQLYLLTEYAKVATPQEQMEREQRVMNEAMRETTRQVEEGSGRRVTMRRLGNNLLLQELILKPQR